MAGNTHNSTFGQVKYHQDEPLDYRSLALTSEMSHSTASVSPDSAPEGSILKSSIESKCKHLEVTGDSCVVVCKICGLFLPKVSFCCLYQLAQSVRIPLVWVREYESLTMFFVLIFNRAAPVRCGAKTKSSYAPSRWQTFSGASTRSVWRMCHFMLARGISR